MAKISFGQHMFLHFASLVSVLLLQKDLLLSYLFICVFLACICDMQSKYGKEFLCLKSQEEEEVRKMK